MERMYSVNEPLITAHRVKKHDTVHTDLLFVTHTILEFNNICLINLMLFFFTISQLIKHHRSYLLLLTNKQNIGVSYT